MRLPTIQESITPKTQPTEPCLSPQDLKRIRSITNNIAAKSGDFPQECGFGDPAYHRRCWAPKTFVWAASALAHKPLFFEDEALERYGHTCGKWQPLISPAKFFLTFPILPYKMGLTPPNENIYVLGCYRAGDRCPYMLDAIPLSVRASVLEGCGWVGGIAAIQ